MAKDNFGYPANEPCEVCGKYKNNQSEPRFGYVVCEDHQDVPPIEINKYQSEYMTREERIKFCMKCVDFFDNYKYIQWDIMEDYQIDNWVVHFKKILRTEYHVVV